MCCVVMFVAGCGGGTAATGDQPGSTDDGGPRQWLRWFRWLRWLGHRRQRARVPGATGLLAQIDGTTLQVQSADTQTAVTYSASTTFSDTVAAKSPTSWWECASRREVPDRPRAPTAHRRRRPQATLAPTGGGRCRHRGISPAVNGRWLRLWPDSEGQGSPAGGDPETRPARQNGRPQPDPRTGGRRLGSGGNRFGGLGVFGKVTAVNGASFTVESSHPRNSTATTSAPTTQTVQTPTGTQIHQTEPPPPRLWSSANTGSA